MGPAINVAAGAGACYQGTRLQMTRSRKLARKVPQQAFHGAKR